jgi:apolipoprotein N-acyltransferase
MNGAVICFSIVIGLVGGALLWWITRSFLAALMVPVVMVGFVVLALPPAIAPVRPAPDAAALQQSTPETQDDLSMTAALSAFRPI